MAREPDPGDGIFPLSQTARQGSPLDRAMGLANSLGANTDSEVKAAISALVEAVGDYQRQLEALRERVDSAAEALGGVIGGSRKP